MEGNSSHTEEAPLGICHSVAGPQFPGHSSCCFGKEIKDSSRVENPKFSELGKCRSTVSTGKALPGAQSWAKTQIEVTPISLQTTCVRHDPATRSPTHHSRFCLKGKYVNQPGDNFFRNAADLILLPPGCAFTYHLQEESFEHQVFYQFQSLLSTELTQATVPAPNGIRAVFFHENARKKDLPPIFCRRHSKI